MHHMLKQTPNHYNLWFKYIWSNRLSFRRRHRCSMSRVPYFSNAIEAIMKNWTALQWAIQQVCAWFSCTKRPLQIAFLSYVHPWVSRILNKLLNSRNLSTIPWFVESLVISIAMVKGAGGADNRSKESWFLVVVEQWFMENANLLPCEAGPDNQKKLEFKF